MSDSHDPSRGPEERPDDAPQGAVGGNTFSDPIDIQLAEQAEQVWTLSERENAIPCNIIEVDDEAAERAVREAEGPMEKAGPGHLDGGEPEEEASGQDDEVPQATRGGYDYPAPFTRDEVPSAYTAYPQRTVGKLFFQRGGRSFVCSASSIGGDAVWTAGHCLHAGNNRADGWAKNVVFAPAYKDGQAPLGLWKAKQLTVRTDWYKKGNPGGLYQDMGGAILFPLNGRRISQVCGFLGFSSSISRYQHWTQLGYPAGAPFNGRRMQQVCSSYAYAGRVPGSPKPVAVGNDLTGGSSGGPWVIGFGTTNRLNGNNSYRSGSRPQEMVSPAFGAGARSLFTTLRQASA